MKNKMSDVRDHLVAMMEALGDDKCNPATVERAKATSLLAGSYISAVRTEMDAMHLASKLGVLPAAVDPSTIVASPMSKQLPGGRNS